MDKQDKELSTHTNYLGLTIDEWLKWDLHISNRINKCKRLFYASKKAIGKKWGLNGKKVR